MKNRVRNAFRAAEVKLWITVDLIICKDHVAQHCKKVFVYALDHDTVDKCRRRRPFYIKLDTTFALDDAHRKRLVPLEKLLCVVHLITAIQDGKRTIPENFVKTALTRIKQFCHFTFRKYIEATLGRDLCVNNGMSHN